MNLAGGNATPRALGVEPDAESAALLAAVGVRPRQVVLLSPLGLAKGRRLAYRVEAEDGSLVKLRVFESEVSARENEALRAGLERAFAPVRARSGRILLEHWIDGAPLSESAAQERAAEAGALLGRLHARPLPASCDPVTTTAMRRRAAESDLDVLQAEGALTPAEARRVRGELADHDPGRARLAIVHLDFCAENMIVDAGGVLHLVDNEQIAIEPAGYDFGRTFQRWPMSRSAWRGFCDGYRSAGTPEPGADAFWRYVAALVGARVYLQRGSPQLAASLALLRRLLAGDAFGEARLR